MVQKRSIIEIYMCPYVSDADESDLLQAKAYLENPEAFAVATSATAEAPAANEAKEAPKEEEKEEESDEDMVGLMPPL